MTSEGRHESFLSLTTKFAQPSEGNIYPVGDLSRCFTKLTVPSAYTSHSNPIPPTNGTNDLL